MYAIGTDGTKVCEGTEVYDPATDSWSAGEAMGAPCSRIEGCKVRAEVNVLDAMMARVQQR